MSDSSSKRLRAAAKNRPVKPAVPELWLDDGDDDAPAVEI